MEANIFFNQNLGKKIRLYRKLNGYSLKSLSSKLDITPQQLQKYESGVNRISAEKLNQISKILEVKASVILDEQLLDEENKLDEISGFEALVKNFGKIDSEIIRKHLIYSTKFFARNKV